MRSWCQQLLRKPKTQPWMQNGLQTLRNTGFWPWLQWYHCGWNQMLQWHIQTYIPQHNNLYDSSSVFIIHINAAQKARAGSTSALGSEHTCPTCGKDCRARIGLLSHLRTHRPLSTSNWLRVVVIFDYDGRTSSFIIHKETYLNRC